MSEPLVTRDDDVQRGQPCLRGTRFPVATLQSWLDSGGIPYLRRSFSMLNDWSDEDLTIAATYPRLPETLPIEGMLDDEWFIDVESDGTFQVVGWFGPDDRIELKNAIDRASAAIRQWRADCEAWSETRQEM